MKALLRSCGWMAVALAALTTPAYAHPSHGFQVSGLLHSLVHALDAAGFLLVGLTVVVVAAVTIKASLHRAWDRQA